MKNFFTLCSVLLYFISFSKDSEVTRELQSLVYNQELLSRDIDYKITDQSESRLSKVRYIYYRQEINGVEVFGTESNLSLTKIGKVIVSLNNFVRNINEKKKKIDKQKQHS